MATKTAAIKLGGDRTQTQANGNGESPRTVVNIRPPNFRSACFKIIGLAPLVIHRFSAKTKAQMKEKMETGKAASSRKNREPKNTDDTYNESRYISKKGWDGFHAAAIRNAMISACRLVGFKMTLAKLSLFVEADGWDEKEPQIPLVRMISVAILTTWRRKARTGQTWRVAGSVRFGTSGAGRLGGGSVISFTTNVK